MENEEKKSELRIEKSNSPCPNAEAPWTLNKSERKKLEEVSKKLMSMQNEQLRKEAEQKEKLRVDFTNLKFSLVKLVMDTRIVTELKADSIIEQVDKLAQYIHK